MAVSGSKDYSITRATIIESSLRKIGEYDAGETIPGDETAAAAVALNLMVKAWVIRGADIWLRDEITLFLQPDTQSYSLGTAHATRTIAAETTLSSAAAASATTLSLTSSSGMTAADNIGVKLNDNTIHWDTIVSVDSSTAVTLTTGLASAASSGKKVYAYTTKAGRPQKLVYAYRRDKNDIDNEVSIIGESEYLRQSNKGSSGPPVEVWYQPTLTTGTLYVWPVDGGANWDKLIMSVHYLPDDFDAASDNPEFPIEWGQALVYGLADKLAPEYGVPLTERRALKQEAEFELGEALAYDAENASVIFTMDMEG
jgi:hypothetical protein